MLYSVVIPVYNNEPDQIKRCLDSLCGHPGPETEVLLVDDGSDPETALFLEQIASELQNVGVFRMPHRGVSSARNYGTAKAHGKYIVYVDADDEIIPGCLQAFAGLLDQSSPEIVFTDIGRERNLLSEEIIYRNSSYGTVRKENLFSYFLLMNTAALRHESHWLNRAPHGRFVRSDLAKASTFPEDLSFGEDVLWNIKLVSQAENILHIPVQTYVYHKNLKSATQTERPLFPEEVRKLFLRIRSWIPNLEREICTSAVEYFTIMMRLYVFASAAEGRYHRYLEEARTGFWKTNIKGADPRKLKGRYFATAFLYRLHMYRILYGMFWVYYRFIARGE
ncbi:MAG: glycosyltransferase family 2 protein [Blautia sp.]|nr:glycosyltransferase family 2 protein [Blautia sp.]